MCIFYLVKNLYVLTKHIMLRLKKTITTAFTLLFLLASCTYIDERVYSETTLIQWDLNKRQQNTLTEVGILPFSYSKKLSKKTDEVIFQNIRRAESIWHANQLQHYLTDSQAWLNVRIAPQYHNQIFGLNIEGNIVQSSSDFLKIRLSAIDSSGATWLDKIYQQKLSFFSYEKGADHRDAFANIYIQIANDLQQLLLERQNTISRLQSLAKMRFAEQYLSDKFSQYYTTKKGISSIVRLPAANDPFVRPLERIYIRNQQFLDVVNDFYRNFSFNISPSYNFWRKESYRVQVLNTRAERSGRMRQAGGFAALALGVFAINNANTSPNRDSQLARNKRILGSSAILTSAHMIGDSIELLEQSRQHSNLLVELSDSLERELVPTVLEFDTETVTLYGTLEEQSQKWREILQKMYRVEMGLSL